MASGVPHIVTHPTAKTIADGIHRIFTSLSRNMIVGISGRGGAGKSTLANEIQMHLSSMGDKTAIFHIDDFVFPIAIRDANPDKGKARYHDSYDFDTLFGKLLKPLREEFRFSGEIPMLNRQLDKQELRPVTIDGPAIILVEGVQLLRQQFADVFDTKIWIEISFDEGLKRALARTNHLGVTMTEKEKTDQYVDWSTAGYKLYEQHDRPQQQADMIVTYPAIAL